MLRVARLICLAAVDVATDMRDGKGRAEEPLQQIHVCAFEVVAEVRRAQARLAVGEEEDLEDHVCN